MPNLIRMVVLLALLGSRETMAQTIARAGSSAGSVHATVPSILAQNTRLLEAPIGHRQPHAGDVPLENDLEHISPEDAAVDRKINNICRGC